MCLSVALKKKIIIIKNQTNRNRSAAEHNLHACMARDGARVLYPRLAHVDTFAQTNEIVGLVNEISSCLQAWK